MNPWWPLIKMGLIALVVVLVVGYAVTAHFRLNAAEASVEAAELARDSARAQADLQQRAGKLSFEAGARIAKARQVAIDRDRKAEEKIRDAASSLPEQCHAACLAWYAPVVRDRELWRSEIGEGDPRPAAGVRGSGTGAGAAHGR